MTDRVHTFVLTRYTICELVKSPTLCGSPTVISKDGFAACSTLTLGWVSLLTGAPCESCTGGGIRAPGSCVTSSIRSSDSTVFLVTSAGWFPNFEPGGWRRTTCSFCGGSGGRSFVAAGALSPSGPKGPRESSTAWRRTGWWPARRGVRGCRTPGDLMGWDEDASRGLSLAIESALLAHVSRYQERAWESLTSISSKC